MYVEHWWNRTLVTISPIFLKQLLLEQIPKAQKRLMASMYFFSLMGSAAKLLIKSTPGASCRNRTKQSRPAVNFTNILQSAFALIFFLSKNLSSHTAIREKLHKNFSTKKAAHKKLVNWHFNYFTSGERLLHLSAYWITILMKSWNKWESFLSHGKTIS